jgi:phage I-like protein
MIVRTFSVALPEGEIPREFRIFAAGVNTSTKGPVLFDEQSAESAMAAWQRQGVDLMIDLEHLSLDGDTRHYDPDARGWAKLALRSGELWAVDVKWTPDGERRLTERRQRYISPAFITDKDGRVLSVVNVAITALPATHHAQPLIAASRSYQMMDAETIKSAIEAFKSGNGDAAMAILEELVAGLAAEGAGAPADETEAAPDAEEAFAESADPEEKDEEEMTLSEKEEDKPETETRAVLRMFQEMSARLRALESEREVERRNALLATRPDIEQPVLKLLARQPLSEIERFLKETPKRTVPPLAAAASAVATRGATQGTEQGSRLPPDQKAAMDIRMGLVETKKVNVQEGGIMKFGVTVPKGAV